MEELEIVEECIDNEVVPEQYVFVTKSGKAYHTNECCRILKNHEYTKIPISKVGERTPCKMCNKIVKNN